jgi:hypothetical protein
VLVVQQHHVARVVAGCAGAIKELAVGIIVEVAQVNGAIASLLPAQSQKQGTVAHKQYSRVGLKELQHMGQVYQQQGWEAEVKHQTVKSNAFRDQNQIMTEYNAKNKRDQREGFTMMESYAWCPDNKPRGPP